MLLDVITPQMQGLDIRFEQTLLALVLLGKQGFENLRIEVEQHRQGADVDDVLEQLPVARIGVSGIGDFCQRYTDHLHIFTETRGQHRPGAVIEQIAAGLDLGQIGSPGLRVHRHHHVDAAAPAVIALFADARFVPGRHALDIAREDISGADRHAHAHHGLGEQLVGRGRPRAIDVGKLYDEIVDCFDAFHTVSVGFLLRAGVWLSRQ